MAERIEERSENARIKFWKYLGIEVFVVPEVCIKTTMIRVPLSTKFCKTPHCPSAQTLLRYRHRRLSTAAREATDVHLKGCDFCNAELQLLRRHRSAPEEYRSVEMPRQLRRLAEELLAKRPPSFLNIALEPDHQPH